MRTLFAIIGVVCLLGLAGYLGAQYGSQSTAVAFTDTPLKKVSKHTLVEFTRSWSKTLEDTKGVGRGIIEYHWHFTYMFGIDVPKNWDWKIKREGSEVSLVAPPLTLLNEPQFAIDKKIEFNQASGNRQERMDAAAKKIGLKALNGAVPGLVKRGSLVHEHARLSFQDYLLNLLNQANPELPITKLKVTFSN